MAGRRSDKNRDDGLGCFFDLVGILCSGLFLMVTSEDSGIRGLGWGIIVVLAVFFLAKGGSLEIILLTAIVIGLAVFAVYLIVKAITRFKNQKNSKHSISRDDSSTISSNPAVFKNIDLSSSGGTAGTISKSVKKETFEEQLKKLEQQARAVRGVDFRSTRTEEKSRVSENVKSMEGSITPIQNVITPKVKDRYYHSIAEAIKDQRVSVGFKKIMIECIQRTDIKECPGIIWKDDIMFYVLPLMKNSKVYSWPLASIPIILYEKRVNPNPDREFTEVGRAEIAAEFDECFPEYLFGQDGVYTGKFILPVGLEVTNTSGKVLFDMIAAEFHVVDDITQSMWYEKEIKELYQKHILRENGVISFENYTKEKERLMNTYKSREKNEQKYQQQIQAAKELGLL